MSGHRVAHLLSGERAGQAEARHVEEGTVDPMASVTGRSALDEAIIVTRRMIGHIDQMVEAKPPASGSTGASGSVPSVV